MALFDVNTGRRLVENQKFRIMYEGASENSSPFKSAREFIELFVSVFGKLELFKQLFDPLVPLLFRHPIKTGHVVENVIDLSEEIRIEFLRRDADLFSRLFVLTDHVNTVDGNCTARDPCDACDAVYRTRLPRSVRPQKPEELAPWHRKRDVVDGNVRSILFREMIDDEYVLCCLFHAISIAYPRMEDSGRDAKWLLREKYGGRECPAFFADLKRLKASKPLAYIIGTIPFLGTTIHLDSHPLIPRTETEYWVEQALSEMRHGVSSGPVLVLDLCAGSGCIGIAILKALPVAFVDFVEIDECHHKTIAKNIGANGIEPSRTRIYGGDLFECVTDAYDFILTNPPYIDPLLDRTKESVRTHEPHKALYGGRGGIEIIQRIITEAPAHLKAGGVLYLEHEPEQAEAIVELANDLDMQVATHSDQYGIPRFTRMIRKEG